MRHNCRRIPKRQPVEVGNFIFIQNLLSSEEVVVNQRILQVGEDNLDLGGCSQRPNTIR